MARLKSPIQLQGTIGNVTFYKNGEEINAKLKNEVGKSRFQTDPCYEHSRENNPEFGRASSGGALVRKGMKNLFPFATGPDHIGNLTTHLLKIIRSQRGGRRGERQLGYGDFRLLRGHDFNLGSALSYRLHQPYEIRVDREAKTVSLAFEEFIPECGINGPKTTEYFRIKMGAVLVDFGHGKVGTAKTMTGILPYRMMPQEPVELTVSLEAPLARFEQHYADVPEVEATPKLLVVIGVEFFERVLGETCPLEKGIFNATAIVQAENW